MCGDTLILSVGNSSSPQATFSLTLLDGGKGGSFDNPSTPRIYTVWTVNTPLTVPSGVPEPGSLALLAAAAAMALAATRRRG